MKNSKLYEVWQQVPVNYYQLGVKENLLQRIWHYHKINFAKRIIKDLNFTSCLDVGCASGFMLSEVAKSNKNQKFFGIDVYDKAIAYAKKRYPNIHFQVASAEKLPFKDESFDLVLCYETMEHVQDPRKALGEIKRILKGNGYLVLAMDSGNLLFRTIWFIWENTKGRVWKGAHLNPFHHSELERLIKKAGFKIKQKFFSHLKMEVVFVLKK